MCTIGAVRLGASDYALFKNKDFGRDEFDDRLLLTRDVFGVLGTPSWAVADRGRDRFSGFSIGANRYGLLCADANVREEPAEGTNYDVLTEIVLSRAVDVESAIEVIDEALSDGSYWCANLVLADATTIAAIEVRGTESFVRRDQQRITRTNHHVHFGATNRDHDTLTSQPRLDASSRLLARATSIADLLELQRDHGDADVGVCNHSLYQTVYSYTFHRVGPETRLLVTRGHPCGTPTPVELLVPLGDEWSPRAEASFRAAYPSASASPRSR